MDTLISFSTRPRHVSGPPLFSSLHCCRVASIPVSPTQVSASEYLHPHGYADMSRPVRPTLVSPPQPEYAERPYTERPSVKLKISRGRSNIDNSVIVDAAGQSLFSIKSNSRRTILASCKNNVKIAEVKWNRMSPCMDFRGKKMTCEEWLPPVQPESE